MLHIAICDDQEQSLLDAQKSLEDYLSERGNIPAEISAFTASADLESALEQNKIPDILILDICMPGSSGINIAKELREKNSAAKIIFITSSKDWAVEAFSLNATHYLIKPFSRTEFADAMDRAMKSFMGNRSDSKRIMINCGQGLMHTVSVDDIIYIESIGYQRHVHTTGEHLVEVKKTLTQFLAELEGLSPGQFISPYRGYIINLNYVRTVSPRQIEMHDGAKILIKTGDYNKIKRIYFDFVFTSGEESCK